MIKIAIVKADFNEEITNVMLKHARLRAKELGLKITKEVTVPGVFDMPIAIKNLLKRKDVDGIAVIGAVIKGETKHDELISNHVAHSIIKLSLDYEKPIGLGIIGPGATWKKAEKRAAGYAERSVEAVAKMQNELKRISM